MALYDPKKRNYVGVTPIDVPNNTVIAGKNFTQDSPWTEPFSATGLVFEDCNLVNCLLPADAEVRMSGTLKTLPTLADGRKHKAQRTWKVVVESTEEEPGIFADHDIQKTHRVIGIPTAWTDNEVIKTEDLGPA